MDCGRKACIIPFQPPGIKEEGGIMREKMGIRIQNSGFMASKVESFSCQKGGKIDAETWQVGCRGGVVLVFCGVAAERWRIILNF
jgi:hypothetical protein